MSRAAASKPVLLVNAPFFDLYGRVKAGAAHYFPLGLGYIAAYLEQHGFEVELLVEDGRLSVKEEMSRRVAAKEYLMVGFSAMTSAFPAAVRLAGRVKELAPTTPTVIGGPHASGVGPSLLEEHPEFDLVCLGEGEVTSLELARALAGGEGLEGIKGLARRNGQGRVLTNPSRPFLQDLDGLPFPARHLVDFDPFSVSSHVVAGGGVSATMITSRGCPFGCAFCSAHLQMGTKYRFHSEEYVIAELKHLKQTYGLDYVFFQDDTLTVVKKRVRSLCRRMIQEDLGISFGCFSRVDVFDREVAELLKAAGCRLVVFGVESGVSEVLEKISKKISLDQAKQAVDLCRELGIRSYASFVVGFPFENEELIAQTIAFGRNLDADRVTFNPLVPFPGSALYSKELHQPDTVDGWASFLTTGVPPFDSTPGVPAEKLKRMVDKAHLGYYLHPRRALRMVRELGSAARIGAALKTGWGILAGLFRR